MTKNIYNKKPTDYFAGARYDIIEHLKGSQSLHILEIGCGSGDTGSLALEKKIAKTYDGIEFIPEAAEIAKKKLSNVICKNVEQVSFQSLNKKYDCIIFSEVLEHLNDPWQLLNDIAPVLKDGTKIFASSPNISSYKVILALLSGRFNYTQSGVMDQTHLRWFTPYSYENMFSNAGFKTEKLSSVAKLGKKASIMDAITFKKLQYLWQTQIMYIGTYKKLAQNK